MPHYHKHVPYMGPSKQMPLCYLEGPLEVDAFVLHFMQWSMQQCNAWATHEGAASYSNEPFPSKVQFNIRVGHSLLFMHLVTKQETLLSTRPNAFGSKGICKRLFLKQYSHFQAGYQTIGVEIRVGFTNKFARFSSIKVPQSLVLHFYYSLFDYPGKSHEINDPGK